MTPDMVGGLVVIGVIVLLLIMLSELMGVRRDPESIEPPEDKKKHKDKTSS